MRNSLLLTMRLLLVVIGLNLLQPLAWAQLVAAAPKLAVSQQLAGGSKSIPSNAMSLKEALKKLGQENQVSILFEEVVVKDMMISSTLIEKTDKLESKLKSLLKPYGLTAKKVGRDAYVIVEEKTKQKEKSNASVKDTPEATLVEEQEGIALQSNIGVPTKSIQLIEKVVKGKVVDEKGEVLVGVNVAVKGTTKGTSTDIEGNYQISLPTEATTLVFSFIGYEKKEILVNAQTVINITLSSSNQTLGEVVVVGYGSQKKSELVGSVSQLNADQIGKRQVTQVSNALTGQMPGVTVVQRSGRPGRSAGNINIRGIGSFGADASPLILVDNIPVADFNEVDPNDIESVSVLKDASSAAIYGARAANGVVLITTKMGKEGKTQIAYNTYLGIQSPTKFPEVVDSWEYATLYNEAIGSQQFAADIIQKYKDGTDPKYPNVKFLDEIAKNGLIQSHNFSINGGTQNSQYVLSLGYLDQSGIVDKNNFKRYNVRLNLTSKLHEKLTLFTRLSAVGKAISEPSTPGGLDFKGLTQIFSQAVRFPSIHPAKLEDGTYGKGPINTGTPVSWIESASFYNTTGMELVGNARLDWQVLPDFKVSGILGYTNNSLKNKDFQASQVIDPTLTLGPSVLYNDQSSQSYVTSQALAEYRKQLQKHQFNVLVGYSFETQRYEFFSAQRDKLPSNDLTQINLGAPDNQRANGSAYEWALQSIFGRLKYDFAGKYLFESTVRYDGSSRFPTNNKYAFFPSIAGAWRLSEEAFLKDVNWLQDLKIRASWGILGNQNISNYPYQQTYASGQNYSWGGLVYPGVALAALRDPNIHWESTRTADVGIDASFWSGKLNIGVGYFDRYTYDILFRPSASISSVLGVSISETNTGKLTNKGWEITANHQNRIGALKYQVGGNLTITNNEVLDLGVGNVKQPNGLIGNGSNLFIGYPIGMYYGYKSDGLFISEDDIKNYAVQTSVNPRPRPGDIRYQDISGPEGKPDGKVDANYDRTYLGSTIPKYTFGFNLGAQWKNFDVSALLQGVAGVKGNLGGYAGYAFYNTATAQKWHLDRWTPENPRRDAPYPRLELISNQGTPNTVSSDFWNISASYLRIRNVQVGYTLPKINNKKLKMSQLRFYAAAENFKTWSKYRPGWDPEINTSGEFYPILANFTFGANLKF
ncbi:TonB-dependent receptor [Runella sp. MFBS21]|uniref:SusC/RagA family TonB-linked outer membrane protein n=1 Tax=Runella sp. MFBS21 TaxID=3034018 RepID=UPI0023F64169|nr:TonB-dependent receptor [Runella sp. MFBS21]MDF7816996.1 TonB-dependent receptor [Runella sp. MFBS21]